MELEDALFDKLYLENSERLYKVAYALTGSAELAKDLVNDAFFTLLRKWDSLYAHPNLPAWLMVTVKNLAFDEMRSGRSRYGNIMNEDYRIPRSNSDKKTDPQIQRLRELSTEELLDKFAELLDDMTEDTYSTEQLDQYLAVLEGRGALPHTFDAEDALAEFGDKHGRLFAKD
jgi:RNA polymerase sigma factor (sigma-70 family)